MDWRPLPWSLLWRINEFPRPIPLMIRWCALKLLTHFIAFRSVSLEAKTQINSSSSSELELHTFHISSAVFVLLNNVAIFVICMMIKQEFAYYGFRVFEVLLPAVRVFIQSIRKFLSRSAFTPSCSQAVGGRLIRPWVWVLLIVERSSEQLCLINSRAAVISSSLISLIMIPYKGKEGKERTKVFNEY